MSGASDAVAALHEVVQGAYRSTYEAGGAFANAAIAATSASDVVETMAATIAVITAAEALHDAAEIAVKKARAVLAQQMNETGATSIQGKHHTAHLARKAAFLNVVDEALIPRDFFVQPPPALDKRAALSALKDGVQIPGCSMAIPNEMQLVLRPRKETPAA